MRLNFDKKKVTGNIALLIHEFFVEPSKGLDKNVRSLVSILVAPSSEHINSFVQVKIQMTIKMAMHKLFNFRFTVVRVYC